MYRDALTLAADSVNNYITTLQILNKKDHIVYLFQFDAIIMSVRMHIYKITKINGLWGTTYYTVTSIKVKFGVKE